MKRERGPNDQQEEVEKLKVTIMEMEVEIKRLERRNNELEKMLRPSTSQKKGECIIVLKGNVCSRDDESKGRLNGRGDGVKQMNKTLFRFSDTPTNSSSDTEADESVIDESNDGKGKK